MKYRGSGRRVSRSVIMSLSDLRYALTSFHANLAGLVA